MFGGNPGTMGKIAASAMGAGGMSRNFVQGQNNQPQGIGPSNDMLMQLLPILMQQFSQKGRAMAAPDKLAQGIFNRANEPMQFPMQPMPNNQPVMDNNTSFAPTSNFAEGGNKPGIFDQFRTGGDRQVNVDPSKFRFNI